MNEKLWWAIGTICSLLAVIGVGILVVINSVLARRQRFVMKHGQPVRAWIVQANVQAYEKGSWNHPAQVLISPDPSADETYMTQLVERVLESKCEHPSDPDEAQVAEWVTDERYHMFSRFQLPASITQGKDVYIGYVTIDRKYLADGVLAKPYVYCQVVWQAPRRELVMLPYPEKEEI